MLIQTDFLIEYFSFVHISMSATCLDRNTTDMVQAITEILVLQSLISTTLNLAEDFFEILNISLNYYPTQ